MHGGTGCHFTHALICICPLPVLARLAQPGFAEVILSQLALVHTLSRVYSSSCLVSANAIPHEIVCLAWPTHMTQEAA
ncbi:hypothetical protein F4823DRAFT_604138 [Ustulina deusta]|nr:hypothetical protein F4823DRAFT_604138 [Ustulina deusta]